MLSHDSKKTSHCSGPMRINNEGIWQVEKESKESQISCSEHGQHQVDLKIKSFGALKLKNGLTELTGCSSNLIDDGFFMPLNLADAALGISAFSSTSFIKGA